MADLFGKLKVGFNKSTKVLQTQANSVLETNKIKSELSNLQKRRISLFADAGKTIYEADKNGTFDVNLIDTVLTPIKALDQEISEVEEKLANLKDEKEEKLREIDQQAKLEEAELEAKANTTVENNVPAAEEVVDVDVVVETQEVQQEVEVEIQDQGNQEPVSEQADVPKDETPQQ